MTSEGAGQAQRSAERRLPHRLLDAAVGGVEAVGRLLEPDLIHVGRPGVEVAVQSDLEVQAAQVLEVVAEAEVDGRIAIHHPRPGLEGRDERRIGIQSVTVVYPVVVEEVALKHVPAQVLARGHTDAVGHPPRIVAYAEVVAHVGIAPLVVQIAHDIARRGVLRRGVEVYHRVERIACPDLQVTGQRTVELPVGHRRRAEGPRGEGRAQRQRRDRIVDLGTQLHRIGHVGFDAQLLGTPDTRDVGLRDLDLFLDLGRGTPRQRRQQQGGKDDLLHRQFSFRIRSLASSTMPSSAGE